MEDIDIDSCWYCGECYKPMSENEDGYIRHNIGFCSEDCADDYDAERSIN